MVSYITNKANSTLCFLHRYLKSCPPHIKSSGYKSLVVPIIEHESTVWDPHLHKDIEKSKKFKDVQQDLLKIIIHGMQA